MFQFVIEREREEETEEAGHEFIDYDWVPRRQRDPKRVRSGFLVETSRAAFFVYEA